MKKLFVLFSALVFTLVLVACGGVTTEAPTTEAPTTAAPTTTAANQFPTLSGVQSEVSINVGDTYDPFAGVTANDPEDGDITDSITIDNLACLYLDDDNVVGEQAGGATCTLVYKVEDSNGAKAQQNSTVTVNVVVDVTTNILVNGDFSLGTNAWANADTSLLDLVNGGAGTAEVTNEELVVTVTAGSWDGGAFPRVNQEGLTFENGKTYEVSIDAKSDTDGAVFMSQVGIFLSSDPWFTQYYYNEDGNFRFTLSTEYQTFTYKFTVTEPTTEVGTITLELGANENVQNYVFYFDNIVIKESTPDADTDAPVVSGLEEVTITQEDTFDALEGVTVADFDATLTVDDIVVTHDGGTDVTEAEGVYTFLTDGVYTFTYTVTDASNNTAAPTRVVNVVGDAEAPEILGLDTAYVVNGFAWNPLGGVSFTDNIDTTITMDDFVVVVKDSTATEVAADTNGLYTFTTNGIYQVLYTLLDSSGNAANETRYVSVVDAPTGMTNLLTEGDFATIASWETWVPDWEVLAVADFDATSGAMVADITDVGDDTWHVQLFNSTTDLVAGTTYVISFEASSTVARDILVEMIDGSNQWKASLNTTTQRFAFEYTAGADVTDAKLNFLLGLVNGAAPSVITIDNVMVYEKVENANIVTEGDFTTATLWGTWVPDWEVLAVADFDASSGAMVADITDVGDDTWHVQLFNTTPDLVAGTIYTITFDASSTVDRDIFFEVIDGNNQYKASLTSTTTTFTFTFLSSADVTDAKINFLLGLVNGAVPSVVTIDNVSITANPVN